MQRFLLSVVVCGLLVSTAQAQWYNLNGPPPYDPYLDNPPPISRGYQDHTTIIYAPVYVPPDPESSVRAAILLRNNWAAYHQAQQQAWEDYWFERQRKAVERYNAKWELIERKREAYRKRRDAKLAAKQAAEQASTGKFSWNSQPSQPQELTEFGQAVQRIIDEADSKER